MDLDTLRDEIRKKDMEIIRLLSERTELARKIGENKIENGLSLRNIAVEEKVIARYVEEGSRYGLSQSAMRTLASTAIKEAVCAESRLLRSRESRTAAIIGGAGKMGGWMSDMMTSLGHDVMIIDPASGNGRTIGDCRDADIVVISVPIHAVSSVYRQLEGICSKDALIFDLSSLKTSIIDTVRDMAKRMKVCSVHPMFGPSAESLYDRNVVICNCGNMDAVNEAKELFDNRGGSIRIMEIEEHDGYMSYVLGLTHAVNIALFTVLERSGYKLDDLISVASTTFNKGLDTNRSVAMEDPMLYYEIQHMNGYRGRMWSLFSEAVNEIKDASMDDDPTRFREIMDAGRSYFGQ